MRFTIWQLLTFFIFLSFLFGFIGRYRIACVNQHRLIAWVKARGAIVSLNDGTFFDHEDPPGFLWKVFGRENTFRIGGISGRLFITCDEDAQSFFQLLSEVEIKKDPILVFANFSPNVSLEMIGRFIAFEEFNATVRETPDSVVRQAVIRDGRWVLQYKGDTQTYSRTR